MLRAKLNPHSTWVEKDKKNTKIAPLFAMLRAPWAVNTSGSSSVALSCIALGANSPRRVVEPVMETPLVKHMSLSCTILKDWGAFRGNTATNPPWLYPSSPSSGLLPATAIDLTLSWTDLWSALVHPVSCSTSHNFTTFLGNALFSSNVFLFLF